MLKPPSPLEDPANFQRNLTLYVEEIGRASEAELVELLERQGGQVSLDVACYARVVSPQMARHLAGSGSRAPYLLAANPHLEVESAEELLAKFARLSPERLLGCLSILFRRGDLRISPQALVEVRRSLVQAASEEEEGRRVHVHLHLDRLEEAVERFPDAAGYAQYLLSCYREQEEVHPHAHEWEFWDSPQKRDWAGRQLVMHPLCTEAEALRLLDAFPNPMLAVQLARGRRGGSQAPPNDLIRSLRIRPRLRDYLGETGIAENLALHPDPEDFRAAVAVLLERDAEALEKVFQNPELTDAIMGGLEASQVTRLLAHPSAEVRLRLIAALPGLARPGEPVLISSSGGRARS